MDNGKIAKPNEFPYMVFIKKNSVTGSSCSGTMISRRDVITSAACLIDINPGNEVCFISPSKVDCVLNESDGNLVCDQFCSLNQLTWF